MEAKNNYPSLTLIFANHPRKEISLGVASFKKLVAQIGLGGTLSKKLVALLSLGGTLSKKLVALLTLGGTPSKKLVALVTLGGIPSKKLVALLTLGGTFSKKLVAQVGRRMGMYYIELLMECFIPKFASENLEYPEGKARKRKINNK